MEDPPALRNLFLSAFTRASLSEWNFGDSIGEKLSFPIYSKRCFCFRPLEHAYLHRILVDRCLDLPFFNFLIFFFCFLFPSRSNLGWIFLKRFFDEILRLRMEGNVQNRKIICLEKIKLLTIKGNEKKERERVHLINWKSRIFLESRRRSIEFFRAIHEQSTRAPGWVYFLPTLPRIPPTILLSTFDNFQGNLIIEGRDITCPAARSNEKRSTKNGSRYWKRYVFLRRHVKNFHPRSPGCALAKFHQIAR